MKLDYARIEVLVENMAALKRLAKSGTNSAEAAAEVARLKNSIRTMRAQMPELELGTADDKFEARYGVLPDL